MKITREQILAAIKKHDDMADRGCNTEMVLTEHGVEEAFARPGKPGDKLDFSDTSTMGAVSLARAVRGYALLTGQIELRPGYQPVSVRIVNTPQSLSLLASLSGIWMDGFVTGIVLARQLREAEKEG